MKRGSSSRGSGRNLKSNVKTRRAGRLALHALSVAATMAAAHEAIGQSALYWDRNGTSAAAGAGLAAVSGTWSATEVNWNTDSAGGTAGALSAWVDASTANFSAGGAIVQPSTITVSGTNI